MAGGVFGLSLHKKLWLLVRVYAHKLRGGRRKDQLPRHHNKHKDVDWGCCRIFGGLMLFFVLFLAGLCLPLLGLGSLWAGLVMGLSILVMGLSIFGIFIMLIMLIAAVAEALWRSQHSDTS